MSWEKAELRNGRVSALSGRRSANKLGRLRFSILLNRIRQFRRIAPSTMPALMGHSIDALPGVSTTQSTLLPVTRISRSHAPHLSFPRSAPER